MADIPLNPDNPSSDAAALDDELKKSKIYESHERTAQQSTSPVSDTHKGSGDSQESNFRDSTKELETKKDALKQDHTEATIEKTPSSPTKSSLTPTDQHKPVSNDTDFQLTDREGLILSRFDHVDTPNLSLGNGLNGNITNVNGLNLGNTSQNNTSTNLNQNSGSILNNREPQSAEIITGEIVAKEDTPFNLGISLHEETFEALAGIEYTITAPLSAKLYLNNILLTPSPTGVYLVPGDDIAHLTVTPPQDYSGSMVFNVTASGTLPSTGETITTPNKAITVDVQAVADTPFLQLTDVSGAEDTTISLNIQAHQTDIDGSETLSIRIQGIPEDATLNHGMRESTTGDWILTETDLLNLTLTAAPNYSGSLNLNVVVTSTEPNGSYATQSDQFTVTFTPVADAPTVSIHNATTLEDTFVQLNPTVNLVDVDGSETLSSLVLSNVPPNATLEIRDSTGTVVHTFTGSSSYQLLPYWDNTKSLFFKPPTDYPTPTSNEISLSISATSQDGSDTATTTRDFQITVLPDADNPAVFTVPTDPVTIKEEGTAQVPINFVVGDTDGSETYQIYLDGLPEGLMITDNSGHSTTVGASGTVNISGFTLSALQFSLENKPDYGGEEYGFTGNPTITVRAEITDTSGGNTSTKQVEEQFVLNIVPVAEDANIITNSSSGNEDSKILLNFTAGVKDPSEELSHLTLKDIPPGSKIFFEVSSGVFVEKSISGGQIDLVANGWTPTTQVYIQPPLNSNVDFNLTLQGTTTEPRFGDTHIGPNVSLPVTVIGIADPVTASAENRVVNEEGRVQLVLNGSLTDTDGSESISYEITGDLQGGLLQIKTGTNTYTTLSPTSGNHYLINASDIGNIYYQAGTNFNGTVNLTLQTIAQENDNTTSTGTSRSDLVPFTITVNPVADQPTVPTTAISISTFEDTWASLPTPAFVNPDPTHDVMTVMINLPAGWSLKAAGHDVQVSSGAGINVTGWTGLQILPPKDSNVDATGTFTAYTTDVNGQQSAVTTKPFTVDVKSVVDDFTINPITSNTTSVYSSSETPNGLYGFEDPSTNVGRVKFTNGFLSVTKEDDNQDGSESFSYQLNVSSATHPNQTSQTNLDGFSLYYQGNLISKSATGWVLTQAQMNDQGNLSLQGPKDFSGKVNLQFTVTNKDTDLDPGDADPTLTKTASFDVMIYGIADKPTLSVSNVFGNEDSYIPLKISGALTDLTSEDLYFVIDGVPNGGGAGLFVNTGAGGYINISALPNTTKIPGTTTDQWIIKATDITALNNGFANLSTLAFKPPVESNDDFTLTVQTKSVELNNNTPSGTSYSDSQTFTINVKGVADAPNVTFTTVQGTEDTQFDLHTLLVHSGELANSPSDSSERMSVVIDMNTAPAGSKISGAIPLGGNLWSYAGGTELDLSSIKITPPANYSGQFNLSVKVVATENDGDYKSTVINLPVHITPVVDSLSISGGGTGYEDGNAISGNINPDDSGGGIPITVNLKVGDTTGNLVGENGSEKLDQVVFIKVLTPGATLAGLTPNSDGEYQITIPAGQFIYSIPNLVLVPPTDFGGTVEISVRGRSYEIDSQSPSTLIYGGYVTQLLNVTVIPDADVPVISNASFVDLNPSSPDVEAYQNSFEGYVYQVKFDITNNDRDIDGTTSEGLSYHVTVPEGCSVIGGIALGNNTWLINVANSSDTVIAQNLEIHVPIDYPAGTNFQVTITPYSTEQLNGDTQAGSSITLTDTFLSGGGGSGTGNGNDANNDCVTDQRIKEDTSFNLFTTGNQIKDQIGTSTAKIRIGTTDPGDMEHLLIFDNSSQSYRALDSYTNGTIISLGNNQSVKVIQNANGTISLEATNINAVKAISLMPPLNSNEDFTLTFDVKSSSGSSLGTFESQIKVVGVADSADFTGPTAFTANEGSSVSLAGVMIASTDQDGSEVVTAYIRVPNSQFSVTGALQDPTDSTRWIITTTNATNLDLSNIKVVPPAHYVGDATISITATTQENDGDTQATQQNYTLHFNPVSNGGSIVSTTPAGVEDTPLSLAHITTALVDSNEVIGNYTIKVPQGFSITGTPATSVVNPDGSITYTLSNNLAGYNLIPLENYSGNVSLQVTTSSQNNDGTNISVPVAITGTVNLTFNPVVDGVIFNNAGAVVNGTEDSSGIVLPISYTLIDSSETVQSILITNVPTGYQIANANNNGNGSWVVNNLNALGNVKLIPPKDASGTVDLNVSIITAESDGSTKTDSTNLYVNVKAVADIPLIFQSPGTIHVTEDTTGFKLQNVVNGNFFELTQQDSDGSEKLFLEVRSNNVPSGFDIVDQNGQSYKKNTVGNDVYWDIPEADLTTAKVIIPTNYSTPLAGITLTAIARSEDTSATYPAGSSVDSNYSATQNITLIVDAVADQATITTPPSFTMSEDPSTPISIPGFSVALTDTDGSERFSSVTFTGLAAGTQLYIGTTLIGTSSGTSSVLTLANPGAYGSLEDIRVLPPSNYPTATSNSLGALTVTAVTIEATNGNTATITKSFPITVTPVADVSTATFNISDNTFSEPQADGQFTSIHSGTFATISDTNSENFTHLEITPPSGALPAGITSWSDIEFKIGSTVATFDGTKWNFNFTTATTLSDLSIKVPQYFQGSLNFNSSVTIVDKSGTLSDTGIKTDSFAINVTPMSSSVTLTVPDNLIIHENILSTDPDSALTGLSAALSDSSETINSMKLKLVSDTGSVKLFLGTTGTEIIADNNGYFHISPTDLNNLHIQPPVDYNGNINGEFVVVSQDDSAAPLTTTKNFVITTIAIDNEPEPTPDITPATFSINTETVEECGSANLNSNFSSVLQSSGVNFSAKTQNVNDDEANYKQVDLKDQLSSFDGIKTLEISGLPHEMHLFNQDSAGFHSVGVSDGNGGFYITAEEAKELYINSEDTHNTINLEITLHHENQDKTSTSLDFQLDPNTGHLGASQNIFNHYEGVQLATSSIIPHDTFAFSGGYMTPTLNELGFVEYQAEHGVIINHNGDNTTPQNTPAHSTEAITDTTPASDIGTPTDHMGTVIDQTHNH